MKYEEAEVLEKREIECWWCKTCGKGYGLEHSARYCCATSRPCASCGDPTSEIYSIACPACSAKEYADRIQNLYDKAETVEWDDG